MLSSGFAGIPHPNLLVDHQRSRSAAVAEPRGANGEAVTDQGGRLQIGIPGRIASEFAPLLSRLPRSKSEGAVNRSFRVRAEEHSGAI
jgi:hypothetical protein